MPVVEPHARASRRIVNPPAFAGAAYAMRNASTLRRRSAALARRQRRFAAAASRLAQAERRSDQSQRRGVEAEVSRWQIHRAITLAKDEDEASRVGPGGPSRRLLGFVRRGSDRPVVRERPGCTYRTQPGTWCWLRAAVSRRTSANVTRRSAPTPRRSSPARPRGKRRSVCGIASDRWVR